MLKRKFSLAVAATSAAALLAVAGCGATATPIQVNLAASEVLNKTATQAQDVSSYTVDLVANAKDAQRGEGKLQGRMLYQSKPELALDLTVDQASFAGQSLPGGARVILLGQTLYVKVDALKTVMGATKPWMKVDLAKTGDQNEVQKTLDQVRQFDLATVTKMVTASKDVKSVGSENVNGTATTHYSGTFPVDAAMAQLPADQQERAKGNVAELKNIKFDIWVDAQGLPAKIAMNGAKGGASFDATLFFKGFNEPVSIKAPAADQVGELPQTGN